MHHPDYIPQADMKFLEWATVFVHALGKSLARFGFPNELYEKLTQQLADFTKKFELATAPSTRTSVAVLEKNIARNTLKTTLRQAVKEHLTYNSALTNVDRDNLGLPVHKTSHTRAQVAHTYPAFNVDTSMLRRLTVHFYNWESASKAKPRGQYAVEIRWILSDVPLVNVSDLLHSAFVTRSPFMLEFDDQERGKTVYFVLCWVNTRGQKGPWSEIRSAIIP
ncbi:MAG: hypothetical protein LBT49_02080 [Prevotellaceae bacterium]|jgi:hypothetical protein|nr:hypothetical protein [Prevotellaceae bacterium]